MTTQYKNHSRKRTPWDCNTRLSPMETFIKSKYLDSYDYKHPFIKETMEADLLNSYEVTCCKRCASTDFKKKGFTKNGIQRYYCNICKRYFNVLTELCLIITRLQYPNGLNSVWVFSDMRVSI